MGREAHKGTSRGLLLAFDIGTTFSGISYAVLDPGEIPQIKGVTRFPAHEHMGGNSKIPSILYYDKEGKRRATGAEALLADNVDTAEEEGWFKVEWWKLHLAPKALRGDLPVDMPPQLPPQKSIFNIYVDFLQYLFQCAEVYIKESHAGGHLFWNSVKSNISVILSHPNGWEGQQQGMMRDAAVSAGLVPDSEDGRSRVSFVTEGEASFNFCVNSGLSADAIQVGHNVVVIDAGGGTIDVSAYVVRNTDPLSVEEIFAPECRMLGSATVTKRAADYIAARLHSCKFDTPEQISYITECFDSTSKRLFGNGNFTDPVFIKFGGPNDKDSSIGIRAGKLKLDGNAVASFFNPCVNGIMEAVQLHISKLDVKKTAVLLVGGFAGSPYLFQQLEMRLKALDLSLTRPDGQTNKAVADGTIAYRLDHSVTSRIARMNYGVKCSILYDSSDPEHIKRHGKADTAESGREMIPDGFKVVLKKGTSVSSTQEFRQSFHRSSLNADTLNETSASIHGYKGSLTDPRWCDEDKDQFYVVCTVDADTSGITKQYLTNDNGEKYYQQEVDVILLFGLTELKAQLSWIDSGGKEQKSDARVVYDMKDADYYKLQ